jgi:hypothetical protein
VYKFCNFNLENLNFSHLSVCVYTTRKCSIDAIDMFVLYQYAYIKFIFMFILLIFTEHSHYQLETPSLDKAVAILAAAVCKECQKRSAL